MIQFIIGVWFGIAILAVLTVGGGDGKGKDK